MIQFITRVKNWLLQVTAQHAPGARTVRVWLHRMRGVELGRDVFIGTDVIIETAYPKLVSMGDRASLSVRTIVMAHNRGDAVSSDQQPTVRIGSDVYVGAGAIILPGVTLGEGAVVAAGSVVSRPVPPRTVVRGNPARPVASCEVPLTAGYRKFAAGLRSIRGRRS